MTRLSIREASEKFGLSRARLYKLIDEGKIKGFRSLERGRNAKSWVEPQSIEKHILTRTGYGGGSKKLVANGDYVPVREAAERTGYCCSYIYKLVTRGSIAGLRPAKRIGWLVHIQDLQNLKLKKRHY